MATVLTRWFAPVVLAAGLGAVAATAPAPARADELSRVIVDVADVVFRAGYPYYRYDRDYRDRLVVVHDYRGHPTYYRRVYRAGPPYGNAYGYWNNAPRGNCNKHGRCTTRYYDARYDRRHDRRYDHRYDHRYEHRYDHRYDRAYYQDRRWDDRRDRYDRYDRRWRGD
ncbi:hypothetical protein [Lysobacter arvi]|uniref:DUF3300 domain-containing protein n=1 Tax=Lysobacter arvi TaxID=3038776 RepID=A0ABU1CFI6_9GAMM|nr:hypothetical protein [Lysobacter arvi]MDR0183715.1 hypothetical protein [Lysobacter arvi]